MISPQKERAAAQKNGRSEYAAAVSATNAAAKMYHNAIRPFVNAMAEGLKHVRIAVNKQFRAGRGDAGFEALAAALENAAKEVAPLIQKALQAGFLKTKLPIAKRRMLDPHCLIDRYGKVYTAQELEGIFKYNPG